MDHKLFTALEIGIIAALIVFVLYLGGVWTPWPSPVTNPTAAPTQALPPTQSQTRTPRPTRTPTPVTPTPTTPPLTRPSGLIAFNSTRTGDTEVFLVDAAGSNLRNLTAHPAEDYVLSWSPDGARLAFFSNRTGWLELYVQAITPAGALAVQLTDTRASNTAYIYPISWTPDGQFILAARSTPWYIGERTHDFHLDLIRTDGSGTTGVFSVEQQYYSSWNATLSPDGRYIAFTTDGSEGYGIYAAELAADGLLAPHLVSRACFNFAWVPKSHRLTCGDGQAVITLDLDGAEKQRVGSIFNYYANAFDWSPDGQWLMLHYQTFSGISGTSGQSFGVLAAVGNTGFEVVNDNAIEAETNAGWSWSADSQWIAYTSSRFGLRDIFIVNIFDQNSVWQPAPATLGDNFSPQWQP